MDLDRYLPIACRTDYSLIPGILYQSVRIIAKSRIQQEEPHQRVSIEEELHGMYSLKSSRCASSS